MAKKHEPQFGAQKGVAEIVDDGPAVLGLGPDDPAAFLSMPCGMERIPTPDLRRELARGLSLTADVLTRLGMVWQELERRGEDLSDLRTGLARTLPLIAAGRLAAEAVVAFAGRPQLLRAMEGVPLARQRALAAGEEVAVIDPADPAAVQRMPLAALPSAALRLVFADGDLRPPEAQRLALRPRPQRRGDPGYRYRPRYDAATGEVRVGRMTVRLADLLSAVAAASGPDHPPPADVPEDVAMVKTRLTRAEYERFQALCRRHELPDWEMLRKAMRAFGLI